MQGVLVFASAAARDAAITSPQEGQCCYLKDTDAVLTYSGSAWVGFDDSNAIQNAIVDAKGDIVAASAADTPARLAVGSNGETLVADSSTSTGLRYQGTMAGGRNALINGGFDYWQRGTSGFSLGGAYNADRWKFIQDGAGLTGTVTQQALTAGSIFGVDSPYCWQWSVTVAGSGATTNQIYQLVENVQTFAGQTAVLSFYAKSDATRTAVAPTVNQNFGSGGSGAVGATVTATSGNPTNLTTSWQRFSYTVALPSITGKTIGTGSHLEVSIKFPINTTQVTQLVGCQLEVGSVPTQFTRAGGTLQGELAACQRYYYRATVSTFNQPFAMGQCYNTTSAYGIVPFPVTMRTLPSALEQSGTAADYKLTTSAFGGSTVTAVPTFNAATQNAGTVVFTASAVFTAGHATSLVSNASGAYLGWSAEL
jgi:hypothetical protein